MCKFKLNGKFKIDKIIYAKPQCKTTYQVGKNKPSVYP